MNRRVNKLYQDGTFAIADGNLIKGKKILDKLMALAPESPMAIELAGDFARCSGEIDEALSWFERLITPEASSDWRAIGFMNIASIHQSQNKTDQAIRYYREALREFEILGEKDQLWSAKQVIGETLVDGGMFQEAAQTFEDLLDELRKYPKRRAYLDMSLDVRVGLAEAYRLLGRLEESRKQWEKIIFVAKKYQDPLQLATAMDGLGVICQIQGRFDEAKDLHSQALQINRNIRNLEGQSVNLGNLARLHIQLEEWEQAEQYIRKSIKIEQKNENLAGIAFDKLILAEIDIGRENYPAAEKKLLQLEAMMTREGKSDDLLAISSQIGLVHRMMGRLDEAYQRQLRVLDRARAMNHADGIPAILDELAEIELARGNKEQAKEYWHEALEHYEKLGSEKMIQSIRSSLAELEF
ncbi:MAG: tetratricopeptide repeat protein [Pirellula sp.]|nr:tetratricopeptide repeat protein [Planctomycetota bacterium]